MRRSTLSERQKAVALLVALGQMSYIEIARMVRVNRNTVTNLLKDAQVQALVEKYQADIERKLLDMALESTHRDNGALMEKAVEKLSAMLDGKSSKQRMEAIRFLLHGALPDQKPQEKPQEESSYPLRLPQEIRALLRPQKY